MYNLKINGKFNSVFDNLEIAIKSAKWFTKKGFDTVVIDSVNHTAVFVGIS